MVSGSRQRVDPGQRVHHHGGQAQNTKYCHIVNICGHLVTLHDAVLECSLPSLCRSMYVELLEFSS